MFMLLRRIDDRLFCLGLAGVSAFSLVFAYTAQFGFGLEPCEMCLWQRIPHAAAVLIGGAAFFGRRGRAGLWALAVCFLASTVLAGFHAGVEQKWWEGFTACTAQLDTSSFEALRAQIMNAPRARCDTIPWSLFGISMAGYNFLMSAGLAALAAFKLAGAARISRKTAP